MQMKRDPFLNLYLKKRERKWNKDLNVSLEILKVIKPLQDLGTGKDFLKKVAQEIIPRFDRWDSRNTKKLLHGI